MELFNLGGLSEESKLLIKKYISNRDRALGLQASVDELNAESDEILCSIIALLEARPSKKNDRSIRKMRRLTHKWRHRRSQSAKCTKISLAPLSRIAICALAIVAVFSTSVLCFATPVRTAFVNVITGSNNVKQSVSDATTLSGLLAPEALSGYEQSISRSGKNCYVEYCKESTVFTYSVKEGNSISNVDSEYTELESATLFGRDAILFTTPEQNLSGIVCMPTPDYICTLIGDASREELMQIANTISLAK